MPTTDTLTAWTRKDVATHLKTDSKTVGVLMGQHDFPKPVWLGERRPRWAPSLITLWVENGGTLKPPERARRAGRQIVERV